MDTVSVKNQGKEIRSFILDNIPGHPKNIVAVTARKFSVSRTTVHRHLMRLFRDNEIVKTGDTRRATYYLKKSRDKTFSFKIGSGITEDEVLTSYLGETFSGLDKNVLDICEYGFTEMFNNALEHSAGKDVEVNVLWQGETIELRVFDNGVGLFNKIRDAFDLENVRESILHLSKGKLTTDPENHSGEGIFFTSRAFDLFVISSYGLTYLRNNLEDDWFLESRKTARKKGSWISMTIHRNSKRLLRGLFTHYSTDPETPAFDRTHILVGLSQLGDDRYISRSQAKRVLWGLDKFRSVVLDFKNVTTVGQAFVDEVFRVFRARHPEIAIDYTNANEDVMFMINRSLPAKVETSAEK